MKLKFLFSFDSFKSMKLRAMRSKITKSTTMVTNNVFWFTRLFGKGSSNMVLFFLQLMTLKSYMTNHTIATNIFIIFSNMFSNQTLGMYLKRFIFIF